MPEYRIVIETSDGRHCERKKLAASPVDAYWGMMSEMDNPLSVNVTKVEVKKLDPPKTYTVTLTEEERTWASQCIPSNDEHAISLRQKIALARPDGC